MVNAAFVQQAQGDIRRKLQKLGGFAGMNALKLLEVAKKVSVKRDQEAQKEAEWKMKKNVDLLAAATNGWGGHSSTQGRGQGNKGGALGNFPQGWPQGSEPLKKNQCAFCLQEGHWKNECPQLQARCRMTKKKEDFMGLGSIEQAED
jgi:hypothetical protein